MVKYKIEYDEDACIGCGACNANCPDNWIIDDDKHKAKPKKVQLDNIGCNKEAEEGCPVNAIQIKEIK